ncbi:hypothetical protein NS07_v2contig00200-0009 [Nocardia seriolae]|uniref:Imm7 family immunity protein n=1 Tax=Nocardia seriolae TaxID=37332 RepID=UPI0003F46AA0|nr:Imm7 family immunity protein [Nocardia seriolae]GAM51078.1 hypothetical protein NS07_v2contig00200-0009 [Nocardia seriolae]
MFEYHGWVTVQSSAGDEEESARDRAHQAAEQELRNLSSAPGLADIRTVNGMSFVHISGFSNRRAGSGDLAIDTFRNIGKVAPGSYGLLYFRDDEDRGGRNNEFQVLAMRRGEVVEQHDTLLSLCIPVIEDAD